MRRVQRTRRPRSGSANVSSACCFGSADVSSACLRLIKRLLTEHEARLSKSLRQSGVSLQVASMKPRYKMRGVLSFWPVGDWMRRDKTPTLKNQQAKHTTLVIDQDKEFGFAAVDLAKDPPAAGPLAKSTTRHQALDKAPVHPCICRRGLGNEGIRFGACSKKSALFASVPTCGAVPVSPRRGVVVLNSCGLSGIINVDDNETGARAGPLFCIYGGKNLSGGGSGRGKWTRHGRTLRRQACLAA